MPHSLTRMARTTLVWSPKSLIPMPLSSRRSGRWASLAGIGGSAGIESRQCPSCARNSGPNGCFWPRTHVPDTPSAGIAVELSDRDAHPEKRWPVVGMQVSDTSVDRAGPDAAGEVEPGAAVPDQQTSSAAGESGVLARLHHHKVVQWTLAYSAGAYTLLHAVEMVAGALSWPHLVVRVTTLVLLLGVPVAATLAWFHGHRGQRRVSGPELAVLTLMFLLAGSILWWLGPSAHPITGNHPMARTEADAPQVLETAVPHRSVAVLPFVNLSGNEDDQYFSYGVAEEVLNLLARIPDLKVISRTSAFHFAGKDLTAGAIAGQLRVRHVLEGSVRRSDNRVRITAQLIDALDDSHVWSEVYDREVLDVFAAQEAIARAIAQKLEIALDTLPGPARRASSAEAYDLYLRGWHAHRGSWTKDAMLQAQGYFLATLEKDPEFAQAHALLALTYVALGNFRYVDPTEAMRQAQRHAQAALRLDEGLPVAHYAVGWIAISRDFDRLAAESAFRRTIELAPGDHLGYQGLSWALQMGGRYDEALATAEHAHELDPFNVWTRNALQEVYYKRRDYRAAIDQTLLMLKDQPNDPLHSAFLAELYARNDEPEKALKQAEIAMGLAAGNPHLELPVALAYVALGEREKALDMLRKAEELGASQFVSAGSIAVVYASLGDADRAMEWLTDAVRDHDSYVFNLDYPSWDPIRSDRRFVALCDRLNIACATATDG